MSPSSWRRARAPLSTAHSAQIALVTGITGQDGSYLAELLIEKGYTVHGVIRRSSSFNTGRIEHIYSDPHVDQRKLVLHYGDLSDSGNLTSILARVRPDEVYVQQSINRRLQWPA